jgi:protease-4
MQPVSIGREITSLILKIIAIIITVALVFALTDYWYEQSIVSDGSCNIAVFPVEGVILPYSSYDEYSLITTPGMVRDFLTKTTDDPLIAGVLFEINSPGGAPVASEQISDLISELEIPNLSLVGDMAASGAYLVAASADAIITSPMSDVGSIGVTMSYVENSKQNDDEGLTFVELTSAKYKESGNPNKPLTEEEREKFQNDLDIVHDEFVKKIANVRGMDIDKVSSLADGSTMPGIKALEVGLIDGLGGRQVAKEIFAKKLGLATSEISFCEYSSGVLPF